MPREKHAQEQSLDCYPSERISPLRLSTMTGLSKKLTVGSVPYLVRTNSLQLSVYMASASALEFQR